MAVGQFSRYFVTYGLVALSAAGWLPSGNLLMAQGAPAAAAAAAAEELKIIVIAGEDGVNIIKKKTAVQPVVEVRDQNNLPVAGASVTFTLPSTGASGTFLSGAKSLTIVTNASGRAAVASLHPVGTGAFHIGVSASFQGHIAAATIAQTNFATAAAATSAGAGAGAAGGAGGAAGAGAAAGAGTAVGLSTGVITGIVAGVAAAVVTGVVVAVKVTGKSSTPTTAAAGTTPPGTTVGLGGVTVGP